MVILGASVCGVSIGGVSIVILGFIFLHLTLKEKQSYRAFTTNLILKIPSPIIINLIFLFIKSDLE